MVALSAETEDSLVSFAFLNSFSFLQTEMSVLGILRGQQAEEKITIAQTQERDLVEKAQYKKLNGILYGRLLMAVANGSLGYQSLEVSTVLTHAPVHPEAGYAYEAFQAMNTKYEADENFKPWDLDQRLRTSNQLTPEYRLEPATLMQEHLKNIKFAFDSI